MRSLTSQPVLQLAAGRLSGCTQQRRSAPAPQPPPRAAASLLALARRRGAAAAAAAGGEAGSQPGGPSRAASGAKGGPRQRLTAQELVERAAVVLERIISSFNTQAFLEDGTSEVDGAPAERNHALILRQAVLAELDNLDEQFLAALSGYINAASTKQEPQLLRLLVAIRQETLTAVSRQLPAELQVVDALTQTSGREARALLLETVASGGGLVEGLDSALPFSTLDDVENAASRLVEQMEDTDAVVAEAQLLVRTTLAREAARDALQLRRGGATPSGASSEKAARVAQAKVITAAFPPSQLPRWEIALLKELVTVADPTVRRGLLQHAFSEALELGNNPDASATRGGLRPLSTRPPQAGTPWKGGPPAAPPNAPRKADDPNAPPPVRPGRFLDCVVNLLSDLAVAEGLRTQEALALDPIGARVQAVRAETLLVLEDMARFRG